MKGGIVTSIIELITTAIRNRTVGAFGRPPIQTFYSFLQGFAFARKPNCPMDYEFLSEFGTWVHHRFNVTSSQSWAAIIHFYSTTDEEEIALFVKLFEEYLEQRNKSKAKGRSSRRSETTRKGSHAKAPRRKEDESASQLKTDNSKLPTP